MIILNSTQIIVNLTLQFKPLSSILKQLSTKFNKTRKRSKNIQHKPTNLIYFTFSCGQFVENTIIPDDKVFVNTFNIVGDKLQEQLRIIISSSIEENEIEPFKMVKKLYLACMDESETTYEPQITD